MADREKVIKGVECHRKKIQTTNAVSCLECPYAEPKPIREWCMSGLMDDIYTLLKEQEWYMLTEDDDGIIHGLPGDDGRYLMTDGKDIWIDEYMDGVSDGIFLDSGRDIREITAWMYMPELPKQGRR